jgi:UTP--glucose-1-phosphate uridylyltransferase
MLGVTSGAPKELIDVGGVPALGRILAECAASGIERVLVVVAPGKDAIVDYVKAVAGRSGMPANIETVEQREPRGLADAIRLGRNFAGDSPLGVALPDNLFVDGEPAMRQLIDAHLDAQTNIVGLVEIFAAEAERRGPTSVYPGRLDGDVFHIERVPDKAARTARFDTGGAPSAFTGIGRFVFTPEAFNVIDDVERTLPAGAELDDIPVMQRLLAKRALIGRRIRGRFLDVGIPEGFREADQYFRS